MMNAETTNAAQTAAVAEQGAKGASKQGATPRKGAPKGQQTAKSAKPNAKAKKATTAKKTPRPERKAAAPRAGSRGAHRKGAMILEMIARASGATGAAAHPNKGTVAASPS